MFLVDSSINLLTQAIYFKIKLVKGFFCMDGTFPEGVVADGCRKKCEKDEILIVNVAKNSWECVPKSFR
jgi:hypothetical protein